MFVLQVFQILEKGSQKRKTAETLMNATSSRLIPEILIFFGEIVCYKLTKKLFYARTTHFHAFFYSFGTG